MNDNFQPRAASCSLTPQTNFTVPNVKSEHFGITSEHFGMSRSLKLSKTKLGKNWN